MDRYFVLNEMDLIMGPLWFFLIIIIAILIRELTIKKAEIKKYFLPGLIVKLVGGVGVCMVYQFYYDPSNGGDTVAYYITSTGIYKAFWKDPFAFLYLVFKPDIPRNEFLTYNYEFYYEYGRGMIYFFNFSAYNVARLAGVASVPAFNSFIAMALLFAAISYIGVWHLFKVFIYYFPDLHQKFAIAIFFIPSVFFWGSGILKDTITFAALGMITYNLFAIFILRKKIIWNALLFFYCAFLIINIKAYILFSYLPLSFFWLFPDSINKITSQRIRFIIKPLVYGLTFTLLPFSLSILGQFNEKFSTENIMEFAKAHQTDLKQDVYYGEKGGSRFDIGYFDGSFSSFVQVAPQAIIATFFRPFLWEARNPVMFLAALEALWMTYLFLNILFKYGLKSFYLALINNPFIQFAFIYALAFGFFVGFTTPVFGSLVRYKIPALPFFVASLYAATYYAQTSKK
jgi:hypothetical protein